MNRTFVIGDLHLGHKNIITYEPELRPFESIEAHDADIVRRWNATVKQSDTVWVLGDVAFGLGAFEHLEQLNGIKRLVMGNHDHYPAARYLEVFRSLHGAVEVRDCILTHVPVHPWQLSRYRANIHGHLHANVLDDPRYINVSADRVNLTPVLLGEILEGL